MVRNSAQCNSRKCSKPRARRQTGEDYTGMLYGAGEAGDPFSVTSQVPGRGSGSGGGEAMIRETRCSPRAGDIGSRMLPNAGWNSFKRHLGIQG